MTPPAPPMGETTVRDAGRADYPRIVELNAAEVTQTSAMDAERVAELASLASVFRVALVGGTVAAFVLAMRERQPYRNDNYAWFAARYARFLYVDRIVVACAYAGRGLGTRLYEDLFATVRAADVELVTCEYNIEPPNPASAKFHARFGFREVGRQTVAGGSKLVSLQAARV